ncbi:MAG: GyrI-like domain-containing protein, partial [Oscillospiraceae bacterium]|nr:GyrI-like domain-containing protein [Oscillospiraceae bacterium]
QIVLLRKLKMPVMDIKKMLSSDDVDVAIDTLTSHLENLKQDAAVSESLSVLMERIIQDVKKEKNLEQVHLYNGAVRTTELSEHGKALQILLSERDRIMSVNQLCNVRIVRLPAMTVASYHAESTTPENDCSEVMNKFVLDNSLHKQSGFRHFGFNNPSPSENNPVYGYEMWVTIPRDFVVAEPFILKEFSGGLYASVTTSMGEIGERWQQLYDWVKNSDRYSVDSSVQWLEECIDFETFFSGNESFQQLDLLEPIKLK